MAGRAISKFFLASAVLLAAGWNAPARADATLTMNVVMPRASSFFIGVYKPWADAIERESNGRIKINIPAASLAPLPRQWEMVTSGVADVALTPNDYIRERVKLPFLAELPFLAPNGVAASVAIWRTQVKYFAQANEYKDVKLLGIWVNGGNTLQTMKRPVAKMDDFKGLKVWVATPNMVQALGDFGATPVTGAAANSMFDYMSGGIVDGAVTGKGSLISFQLARYTKFITYFPGQLGYNAETFFMNKRKYDSLSAEDKAIIDKVSYENLSRFAGQGFVDQDNLADPLIKQNGIQTRVASPEFLEQLKSRVSFFKDNWFKDAKARGIDAQAAYDYFAQQSQEIAAQMAK
ncbi:MAG TPA: TRAP transporter substrate-binding protein [Stellaceae bacterium]|jgi:TRAP-type C4-dicarboxylate transport system substrate-binding protein|nr:TRAP transporter substrate-binding protein [Stellaceae bacterium]